ncbi:MAG TPA: HD domain-containing phosphohydrolase [Anaerolineaceae bacterium]
MLEEGKPPPQTVEEQPQQDTYSGANYDRDRVLSVMKRANEIARIPAAAEMAQAMLSFMMEITQAESANFFQVDSATDELVITNVCGEIEGQHLIGLRLSRKYGLPGVTVCDTKVVVAGDLPAELDWLNVVDPLGAAFKRNVINLPVCSKDSTLGVIQLFNFQQAELDLLVVLGERLAVELEHHRSVDETRNSNERLITLVNILGELTGTLDRNRLLHKITESASQLVGAERSSVFLVDPSTREMLFQVGYQSPEPEKTRPAAREPKTRPVSKSGEFSHFNRSAITVPIKSELSEREETDEHSHILGGLMVFNKQNAAFKEEDAQLMQILAQQASTNLQIAAMYESTDELLLGVIRALATAIDAKDPYTQGHSERVSDYAVLIAREMGFNEEAVDDLRIGSLFHDIGKIGIPDQILLKNGKLDENEYDFMKLHPRLGANILSQVKMLEPSLPAILEHHERLDGTGYPAKLAGEQISWMGRIVAVADVYDAMTSNRPYRTGYRPDEVIAYLRGQAEILFDPGCVEALELALSRSKKSVAGHTGRLYHHP